MKLSMQNSNIRCIISRQNNTIERPSARYLDIFFSIRCLISNIEASSKHRLETHSMTIGIFLEKFESISIKKLKKMNVKLLGLLPILLLSISLQAKTKVACVGNSITENYDLKDYERYPAILQKIIGEDDFEVRNFGAGGTTTIKKGDFPYWTATKYNEVLAWQPDIVVIKLGTNDMRPNNWVYKADIVPDYTELINTFKDLPSNPKIFVCYPLPAYPNNWIQVDVTAMRTEMLPMIDKVIKATDATLIDLQTPFLDKEAFAYDLVHPDFRGTTYMAYLIAPYICPDCNIPPVPDSIFVRISPIDMTDEAKNITTSVSGGTDLSMLIDNDAKTGISVPFSKNAWFAFEMPANKHISGYSITVDAENREKTPVSWVLEGANTGNVWYKIDERNDIKFGEIRTQVFKINFSSASSIPKYKHFRLRVIKNNGDADLKINELQLFGFSATTNANQISGGQVSAQYEGFPGEGIENLADGNIGTKYCVVDKELGWIEYTLPQKTKIGKYSLTSCFGIDSRMPRSWTLKASNNGVKWDVLDVQSHQDFVSGYHTMEYAVNSTEEYTIYRLYLDEIAIGRTYEIAEWQLYKSTANSINTEQGKNGSVYTENQYLYIDGWQDSVKYEIYSTDGKLLYFGEFSDNGVVKMEHSGVYIVYLKVNNENLFKKVIV